MNRIDLEGRVAIVTGAARGIGAAIADRLAASGARIAIWDIDMAVAENTAASIFNAVPFAADVTDPASIDPRLGGDGGGHPARPTSLSTTRASPVPTTRSTNTRSTPGGR